MNKLDIVNAFLNDDFRTEEECTEFFINDTTMSLFYSPTYYESIFVADVLPEVPVENYLHTSFDMVKEMLVKFDKALDYKVKLDATDISTLVMGYNFFPYYNALVGENGNPQVAMRVVEKVFQDMYKPLGHLHKMPVYNNYILNYPKFAEHKEIDIQGNKVMVHGNLILMLILNMYHNQHISALTESKVSRDLISILEMKYDYLLPPNYKPTCDYETLKNDINVELELVSKLRNRDNSKVPHQELYFLVSLIEMRFKNLLVNTLSYGTYECIMLLFSIIIGIEELNGYLQ